MTPVYCGLTHNRRVTTSLGAVNRGWDRKMWCVHTMGFIQPQRRIKRRSLQEMSGTGGYHMK